LVGTGGAQIFGRNIKISLNEWLVIFCGINHPVFSPKGDGILTFSLPGQLLFSIIIQYHE
jgi:hypothetical protein